MFIITLRSPSLSLYRGNGEWCFRLTDASVYDQLTDTVEAFRIHLIDLPVSARDYLQIEEV